MHALRSYTAISVWNLADELPLQLKSVPPLLVHAIGILGFMARRWWGGPRPMQRFGIAFAILTALRQLLGDFDRIAIASALLAWILFLWWLPCYLELLSRQRQRIVLPVAAVAAISLQVSGQTLLHGLDVPLLRGAGGWLIALTMTTGFALLNTRAPTITDQRPVQPVGRAAIALIGCWLFLQLSLLANPGRMAQTADLSLVAANLLVQLGLITGLMLTSFHWRIKRLIAAVALLVLVPLMSTVRGPETWMLVIANTAGVVALAGACTRGKMRNTSWAYPGWLLGSGLLFVFLFGFYSRFEAPLLWTVAAILLVTLSLGVGEERIVGAVQSSAALAAVTLLASLGSLVPASRQAVDSSRGSDQLRLMTYNVHQGYDAFALPAMQRIANELAAADADVIALQEVSRGWNLLGGGDLIAYLHWRFPDHRAVFTSTNGLWGTATLSRVPLQSSGGRVFVANGEFRYGFTSANLASNTQIFSVHLSADLEAGGDSIRNLQAMELAQLAQPTNTILAGDFNAEPRTPVIQRLLAAGLVDVAGKFGLETAGTWPAHSPVDRLDYVFATPDLQPVNARLLRTTASDHLPLVVDFSMVPTRSKP